MGMSQIPSMRIYTRRSRLAIGEMFAESEGLESETRAGMDGATRKIPSNYLQALIKSNFA